MCEEMAKKQAKALAWAEKKQIQGNDGGSLLK